MQGNHAVQLIDQWYARFYEDIDSVTGNGIDRLHGHCGFPGRDHHG